MTKPLYPVSHETKLAALEKRQRRLERRGAGPWHYVGDTGEPAFQNGWGNVGGGLTPMRFRWLLGGGIEIQGSVDGGLTGTVVFTLPVGYRPSGELRLAASDGVGAFVVFRVLATGDVIFGV